LPGSGKSWWADKHVLEQKPGTWIRINKDTLRDMLHAGRFVQGRTEKQIIQARDMLIGTFLVGGVSVVVDDTNLAPFHEERLRGLADANGADFIVQDFTDVPMKVCIERDLKRVRTVGESVIRRMYNQYLAPTPVPPEHIKGGLSAVIVDLDGTLAHMKGRSPFQWDKVGTDVADVAVRDLMYLAWNDSEVIIVSGRDAVCREATIQWLKENDVYYDALWMRAAGDNRDDTIVKQEIYDAHIKGRYNVKFVLDDRNKVVAMWRANGLKVLQVADGDF
jgi:predicted kinase